MNRPAAFGVLAILGLFGLLVMGPAAVSEESEAEAEPSRARPPETPRRPRPEPRPVVVEDGLRVEIVDGSGDRLPAFRHEGAVWVEGTVGRRYQIRLTNPGSKRLEAVVTVDGLDVLDGKAGSFEKRGYIVPPRGSTVIEGFRRSMDEVATFRFSTVGSSYAARKGDDRNVGVIGVAVFEEQRRDPSPPMPRAAGEAAPGAKAAPGDRGIGTGWGEDRTSVVRETTFRRASSRPSSVMELRYDDHDGLVRVGVLDRDPPRRREPEPFPAEPREARFAEPPP